MDRCHRRLVPAVVGPSNENDEMTTIQIRRPHPGHGAGRLIGAALALGLVLAISRLPLDRPQSAAQLQPGGVDAGPALDAAGTFGLLPPAERVAFWETRGRCRRIVPRLDPPRRRVSRPLTCDRLTRRPGARRNGARPRGLTAPDPEQVSVRRALVAFALHDFAGAMHRADEVLAENPTDLAALGVAGDARLETGDIAGARARYEELARLAPSPAAWSRLGRLAFLTGDTKAPFGSSRGRRPTSLDDGAPDAVAFYQYQLGELRRAAGDLSGAVAAYAASPGRLAGLRAGHGGPCRGEGRDGAAG